MVDGVKDLDAVRRKRKAAYLKRVSEAADSLPMGDGKDEILGALESILRNTYGAKYDPLLDRYRFPPESFEYLGVAPSNEHLVGHLEIMVAQSTTHKPSRETLRLALERLLQAERNMYNKGVYNALVAPPEATEGLLQYALSIIAEATPAEVAYVETQIVSILQQFFLKLYSMAPMSRGDAKILVITGPTGVGKSAFVEQMFRQTIPGFFSCPTGNDWLLDNNSKADHLAGSVGLLWDEVQVARGSKGDQLAAAFKSIITQTTFSLPRKYVSTANFHNYLTVFATAQGDVSEFIPHDPGISRNRRVLEIRVKDLPMEEGYARFKQICNVDFKEVFRQVHRKYWIEGTYPPRYRDPLIPHREALAAMQKAAATERRVTYRAEQILREDLNAVCSSVGEYAVEATAFIQTASAIFAAERSRGLKISISRIRSLHPNGVIIRPRVGDERIRAVRITKHEEGEPFPEALEGALYRLDPVENKWHPIPHDFGVEEPE